MALKRVALTLFSVVEALIVLMASSFASSTLFISTAFSFSFLLISRSPPFIMFSKFSLALAF
jgi:hypothetical protein